LPDLGLGPNSLQPRGKLLVVVGPSGAGKDSLIARARQDLSGDTSVLFVRRVVTRTAVASTEDHDCLSPNEFAIARASGQFAVHWDAHGLSYGIPATVHAHIGSGGVAVVNGSRAALPDIRAAFGKIVIIHVTARPEVLAERLAGRGRESKTDILRRLQRAPIDVPGCEDRVEIDNSGALETAAAIFLETIRRSATKIVHDGSTRYVQAIENQNGDG
jgi:ribose 1,5-bisphosphokinase